MYGWLPIGDTILLLTIQMAAVPSIPQYLLVQNVLRQKTHMPNKGLDRNYAKEARERREKAFRKKVAKNPIYAKVVREDVQTKLDKILPVKLAGKKEEIDRLTDELGKVSFENNARGMAIQEMGQAIQNMRDMASHWATITSNTKTIVTSLHIPAGILIGGWIVWQLVVKLKG